MELIAGVDEVGRGPLAGPVMAAAVILPENHTILGLKDSKKLTEKKRISLFKKIKKQALSIGIGSVDERIIDKINIRKASFKAMELALVNLHIKPNRALIDGFTLENQFIPNEGIIGGDDIIDCIKAASIIAKVTRDNLMNQYDLIFNEYKFKNNKGYGTLFHKNALLKFKASPIHRKTFKPVFNYLPTFKWLIDSNRINWMGNRLAGLYLLNKNYKIKNVIYNHPRDNLIYIVEKKKVQWAVIIFTRFKNFGYLFDDKKTIFKNLLSNGIKNELNKLYSEENNFRFDVINVTLKKDSPSLNSIKNIKLK